MATNTLSLAGATSKLIKGDLVDRRFSQRFLQMALLAGFCAVLIFGPLALGIVQYWSVAAFELGASLLLLIWLASQTIGSNIKVQYSPLFAPAIAFAALVTLQITLQQTAYPYASLSEAWLFAGYGMLLFLAVQLLAGNRLERFARILAILGSSYALLSIIEGFTSDGKIFWVIKPRDGYVYGSYVNHNHYAGLIELLFPFVLVLAFDPSLHRAKRVVLIFSSVLMVASVFLSGSRAGLLSLMVEIAFIAVLWMRQQGKKTVVMVGLSLALVTAALLSWISPQITTNHMFSVHDASRLLIYRDSVSMFFAHPFLGSGLGTFPMVFPHYRVFFDGFFTNHAHNDYLEQLLDTGLAGLAIAIWFIVQLYRHGFRNGLAKQSWPSTGTRTAALAACTGFLFHSFTDFNLHIPANAALFYVVCVVATARAQSSRIPRRTQCLQIDRGESTGAETPA